MKSWKIAQLVGVLMLLAGVVIRVSGEMLGMWLVVLGILIYAVSRVTIWLKSEKV